MAQLLLENLRNKIDLSSEEEQLILSRTERKSYKARTILVKPADDAHFTYFVLQRILRSHMVDLYGVGPILSFATAGLWVADMYSYLGKQSATLYIDVTEESGVLILQKKDIEALFLEIPALER